MGLNRGETQIRLPAYKGSGFYCNSNEDPFENSE